MHKPMDPVYVYFLIGVVTTIGIYLAQIAYKARRAAIEAQELVRIVAKSWDGLKRPIIARAYHELVKQAEAKINRKVQS